MSRGLDLNGGRNNEDDDEARKDQLKGLEDRVLASQREMQEMDNLEQIRAMNMKHTQMRSNGAFDDTDSILKVRDQQRNQTLNHDELTEQDEALIKSIHFGKLPASSTSNNIKRLNQQYEQLIEQERQKQSLLFDKSQYDQNHQQKQQIMKTSPRFKIKRKRKSEESTDIKKLKYFSQNEVINPEKDYSSPKFGSLLDVYGSDSD